jgi:hypothetical protein
MFKKVQRNELNICLGSVGNTQTPRFLSQYGVKSVITDSSIKRFLPAAPENMLAFRAVLICWPEGVAYE